MNQGTTHWAHRCFAADQLHLATAQHVCQFSQKKAGPVPPTPPLPELKLDNTYPFSPAVRRTPSAKGSFWEGCDLKGTTPAPVDLLEQACGRTSKPSKCCMLSGSICATVALQLPGQVCQIHVFGKHNVLRNAVGAVWTAKVKRAFGTLKAQPSACRSCPSESALACGDERLLQAGECKSCRVQFLASLPSLCVQNAKIPLAAHGRFEMFKATQLPSCWFGLVRRLGGAFPFPLHKKLVQTANPNRQSKPPTTELPEQRQGFTVGGPLLQAPP